MKNLTLIFTLIILVCSCEKNNSNVNDSKKNKTRRRYIIAGIIGNSDTLYNLAPGISLIDSCVSDTSYHGFTDQDSIDLFDDGVFDIRFENSRSGYVITGYGQFCPRSFTIYLLSGVQIGYKQSYSEVGLPILLNDTISNNLYWTSEKMQRLFLGPPGDGMEWLNESSCYLAFRFIETNDTIYGWIKMEGLTNVKEYGVNKWLRF